MDTKKGYNKESGRLAAEKIEYEISVLQKSTQLLTWE